MAEGFLYQEYAIGRVPHHLQIKYCSILFFSDGHPVMASGSNLGHIALWNLEERKLHSQMRHAHNGSVSGLKCLPSEPLMITSSPDNSIKVRNGELCQRPDYLIWSMMLKDLCPKVGTFMIKIWTFLMLFTSIQAGQNVVYYMFLWSWVSLTFLNSKICLNFEEK